MNNPAMTAISLNTFFMAYPNSSPPKNPPPTVAAEEATISVLKLQSPEDTILEYGCT
jgi:hypothetical protein